MSARTGAAASSSSSVDGRDANGNDIYAGGGDAPSGLWRGGGDAGDNLRTLAESVDTLLKWRHGQYPTVSYEPNFRACFNLVSSGNDRLLLCQLADQLRQYLAAAVAPRYADATAGGGEALVRALSDDADAYCMSIDVMAPLFQPLERHMRQKQSDEPSLLSQLTRIFGDVIVLPLVPQLLSHLGSLPAAELERCGRTAAILCRADRVCPPLADALRAAAAQRHGQWPPASSADNGDIVVDDACMHLEVAPQPCDPNVRKRPADVESTGGGHKAARY